MGLFSMFSFSGRYNQRNNSNKNKASSGALIRESEPVGTKFTCTYRYRNSKGVIIGYRIEDEWRNWGSWEAATLKDYIRRGEITVDNLKLTSDDRLIELKPIEEKKMENVFGW